MNEHPEQDHDDRLSSYLRSLKGNPLDAMAMFMTERDRNFTSTDELMEFCTLDLSIEETSLHVLFPEHIQQQLTWRKFPPEPFHIPELKFDKDGVSERHRDFLIANASADGFLISAKAKNVMEQFDLGIHRFFPATIIHKMPGLFARKERFECYWLHLIFDPQVQNYVDFPRSIFRDKASLGGRTLSELEIVFDSLADFESYRVKRHSEWAAAPGKAPHHHILPLSLHLLEDIRIPDLFGLGKINSGLKYIQRPLALAMREAGLEGMTLRGTKMLKRG